MLAFAMTHNPRDKTALLFHRLLIARPSNLRFLSRAG
jgi:hypothetical protein